MDVFVAGWGRGFIGRPLRRALPERGHRVRAAERAPAKPRGRGFFSQHSVTNIKRQ